MRSDSTRLSKARSHASRASGRKKRDKEKYLAACKAKFEAEGKVFVVKDEKAFTDERRAKMLQPSTLADDGCVVNKELATVNTKKGN